MSRVVFHGVKNSQKFYGVSTRKKSTQKAIKETCRKQNRVYIYRSGVAKIAR